MKQIEHENILPFYGVSKTFPDEFCLVFAWCENGNIMKYLTDNPDVNRFDLVSILKKVPIYIPDAYPRPRTAIRRGQGVVLSTSQMPGPRRLETGMRSFCLIDES